MTLLGGLRQQFLDVGKEAEVQHLVGLIQHQHLDPAEVEGTAVDEVEKTSWGSDSHVDALLEGEKLLVVAGAAVDRQHPGV